MDEDPVFQFFPDTDHVDLYAVLGLVPTAAPDDIKKSYRRLALIHHPDKHASNSEDKKKENSIKFQQVGYAYAVLGDEKRRKRYDETGRTDEGGLGFGPGDDEGGWEAYFEGMFEEVTKARLDELKAEYVGSQEEKDDIKDEYEVGQGDIEHIMAHIPFSTYEDEPRIVSIVQSLIKAKEISSTPTWQKQVKDEKAKRVRKKRGEAEAAEAEEAAKDLGVWDEFYGSGQKGKRKGKAPTKNKEEDGALQALIQKRQTTRGSFLDNLAAKYGAMEGNEEMEMGDGQKKKKGTAKGKGKKRTRPEEDEKDVEMPSRSKRRKTPELDDEEFERIQARLVAQKEASGTAKSTVLNVGGRSKRK